MRVRNILIIGYLLCACACGGPHGTAETTGMPRAAIAPTAMGAPPALSSAELAAQLAQLDALATPAGVDTASFAELKSALRLTLESRPREASAIPDQARNTVTDLAIVDDGAGGFNLEWTYRNVGDYSLDGEVNISDLTPLGVNLGKTSASPDWATAQAADGDANGSVTISDLTPIGANFFSQALGYNVYSGASEAGPWVLVDTLALASATAGYPRQFSYALGAAPAPYYTVMPYDTEGKDWYGSGAAFEPGQTVVVAEASIGPGGGTLTGPAGSPLEGVSVSFPAGALPRAAEISLGYNTGSLTPVEGVFDGPVIEIQTDYPAEFEEPIEITMPYSDPGEYLPVPYYIDAEGRLDSCQLTELDRVNGSMAFVTWHASLYAAIKARSGPPARTAYATTFKPEKDGFQVSNNWPSNFTGGNCWGMTAFARWYWRTQDPDLYGEFMYDVDSVKGQNIIGHRAQLSIARKAQDYLALKTIQSEDLNHEEIFNLVRNMMVESGSPVLIGVHRDGGGHSLLAYSYDEDSLAIYDPNKPFPNPERELAFNSIVFEEYDNGRKYQDFEYGGLGSFLAEPYEEILADARERFEDIHATLEVHSPEDGATVDTPTVTLSVTAHSSEVLVEKMQLDVMPDAGANYTLTQTPFDPQAGLYNFLVTLEPGRNAIRFKAKGFDDDNCYVNLDHNLSNIDFIVHRQIPESDVPIFVVYDQGIPVPDAISAASGIATFDPDNEFGDIASTVPHNETRVVLSHHNFEWGGPILYGREHKVRAYRFGTPYDPFNFTITVYLNLQEPDPGFVELRDHAEDHQWEEVLQFSGTLTEGYNDGGDLETLPPGPGLSEVFTFTPHLPIAP